jgi:hypothetical protein
VKTQKVVLELIESMIKNWDLRFKNIVDRRYQQWAQWNIGTL